MTKHNDIYNIALNATKKYNRTRYFNIKKNDLEIIFSIRTNINITFGEECFNSIEIESDLYLLYYKGVNLNQISCVPEHRCADWTLKTKRNLDIVSATFGCSLFLPTGLEGYGIGKVLLNQLIQIGQELFPHASISLLLTASNADSNDNIVRRDLFYNRFGFKLAYQDKMNKKSGGTGYIDRIDKLKTFRLEERRDIEEISIFPKVHEIQHLQYEIEDKIDVNKNLLKSIRENLDENHRLSRYKYTTYILSAIVTSLIGLLITLYIN